MGEAQRGIIAHVAAVVDVADADVELTVEHRVVDFRQGEACHALTCCEGFCHTAPAVNLYQYFPRRR
ncbi:hypothetical protein D3C72_2313670 [compost metagenome]